MSDKTQSVSASTQDSTSKPIRMGDVKALHNIVVAGTDLCFDVEWTTGERSMNKAHCHQNITLKQLRDLVHSILNTNIDRKFEPKVKKYLDDKAVDYEQIRRNIKEQRDEQRQQLDAMKAEMDKVSVGASRRVVKKVDTRNREPLPEPDNVKKGDPMSVMHKPRHGWGSKQANSKNVHVKTPPTTDEESDNSSVDLDEGKEANARGKPILTNMSKVTKADKAKDKKDKKDDAGGNDFISRSKRSMRAIKDSLKSTARSIKSKTDALMKKISKKTDKKGRDDKEENCEMYPRRRPEKKDGGDKKDGKNDEKKRNEKKDKKDEDKSKKVNHKSKKDEDKSKKINQKSHKSVKIDDKKRQGAKVPERKNDKSVKSTKSTKKSGK